MPAYLIEVEENLSVKEIVDKVYYDNVKTDPPNAFKITENTLDIVTKELESELVANEQNNALFIMYAL